MLHICYVTLCGIVTLESGGEVRDSSRLQRSSPSSDKELHAGHARWLARSSSGLLFIAWTHVMPQNNAWLVVKWTTCVSCGFLSHDCLWILSHDWPWILSHDWPWILSHDLAVDFVTWLAVDFVTWLAGFCHMIFSVDWGDMIVCGLCHVTGNWLTTQLLTDGWICSVHIAYVCVCVSGDLVL